MVLKWSKSISQESRGKKIACLTFATFFVIANLYVLWLAYHLGGQEGISEWLIPTVPLGISILFLLLIIQNLNFKGQR
jgi:hypothetical protein